MMKWTLQECRESLTFKISQCNSLYKQTKKENPCDYLNKCRKRACENSISISDVNSQKNRKRRELP